MDFRTICWWASGIVGFHTVDCNAALCCCLLQCFRRYRSAQILLHSLAQQAQDPNDRYLLNKCKFLTFEQLLCISTKLRWHNYGIKSTHFTRINEFAGSLLCWNIVIFLHKTVLCLYTTAGVRNSSNNLRLCSTGAGWNLKLLPTIPKLAAV